MFVAPLPKFLFELELDGVENITNPLTDDVYGDPIIPGLVA
jgi:hypothetical protein